MITHRKTPFLKISFSIIMSIIAILGSYYYVNAKQGKSMTLKETYLSDRQKQLLAQPPLGDDVYIDKLIVEKSKREMHAYQNGQLVKTYPIALGKNPIGHKQFEGDKKTPEVVYTIDDRNPNSSYHKNLGVSYPNERDVAFAKAHGKSAGGLIKIHGIKNGMGDIIGERHLLSDWTDGCIAVTDREMDELFDKVKLGSPIEILP